MIRRPPRSTRTDTLFPYTTPFRSLLVFETATYQGARAAALNVNPCTLVTNAELEQIVGKLKSGPKLGSSFGSEDKARSEEHTSELQSLMRISYAVFCLKTKKHKYTHNNEQSETTTTICNQEL